MPRLAHELTLQNVLAYAKACVDVAETLSILHTDGRRNVVLPSRGAVPIYRTADHVREYFDFPSVEHDWIIRPFTADPCQNVDTETARTHWVEVVAAESTGEPNDSWNYYQECIQRMGDKPATAPASLGPFVMIDTAVSGRAASEIVHAMESCRLDYHLILVVDQMGSKMRQEYQRVLSAYKNRITQISVPNLYTEDRGPALMGTTTVLYPELTRGRHVMSTWLELPFKGVLWDDCHAIPTMTGISQFFSYLHAMHFHATKIVLKRPFGDDEAAVEYYRKSLIANEHLAGKDATFQASRELFSHLDVELTSSLAFRVRG
jgi:hypothetical protein